MRKEWPRDRAESVRYYAVGHTLWGYSHTSRDQSAGINCQKFTCPRGSGPVRVRRELTFSSTLPVGPTAWDVFLWRFGGNRNGIYTLQPDRHGVLGSVKFRLRNGEVGHTVRKAKISMEVKEFIRNPRR